MTLCLIRNLNHLTQKKDGYERKKERWKRKRIGEGERKGKFVQVLDFCLLLVKVIKNTAKLLYRNSKTGISKKKSGRKKKVLRKKNNK